MSPSPQRRSFKWARPPRSPAIRPLPDRDYLVAPGNSAEALAEQIGKTVRAQGWPVPDDAGDIWLALDAFEVTD